MCFFRSTCTHVLLVTLGIFGWLNSAVGYTGKAIEDARAAEETEILGLGITIFVVIVVAGVLAVIGIPIAICFCFSWLCFAKRQPSGHLVNGHSGGKHAAGPPKQGNFNPVYPQNGAPVNLPNKPLPPLPPTNHPLQPQPLYGNEPQPMRPTDLPVFANPTISHAGSMSSYVDQSGLYSGSVLARAESVTSGDANFIPHRFKAPPPGKMARNNDPTWNAITNEVRSWQKAHDIYYTRSRNHDPYARDGNGMSPEESNPNNWYNENNSKANFMY